MEQNRFTEAIEKIDALNRGDPNKELHEDRKEAKELLYSFRMTYWLMKVSPNASEALRLAARAQHLCRWEILRDEYPMDRAGYLKWRTTLKILHANKAVGILESCGYDNELIEKVESLILKKKIKTDVEAQTLEDVACLVFLKYHLSNFITKHDPKKIISIIQKTWGKMSDLGHKYALKIEYSEPANKLIKQALA